MRSTIAAGSPEGRWLPRLVRVTRRPRVTRPDDAGCLPRIPGTDSVVWCLSISSRFSATKATEELRAACSGRGHGAPVPLPRAAQRRVEQSIDTSIRKSARKLTRGPQAAPDVVLVRALILDGEVAANASHGPTLR